MRIVYIICADKFYMQYVKFYMFSMTLCQGNFICCIQNAYTFCKNFAKFRQNIHAAGKISAWKIFMIHTKSYKKCWATYKII